MSDDEASGSGPAGDEKPAPGETFGTYVQRVRRQRGFTQRALAARLGIDFTYLSKLENARDETPSEELIRRLAPILNADAEALLGLAGKVPTELRRLALEEPEFALFLRRLPSMSPDERRRLSTLGPDEPSE